MGHVVAVRQGPGEKYDRNRWPDEPFGGTKYVDAEWFVERCHENAAHNWDDYDGYGGGGYYARIDPAKADVMRAAIREHGVNVEAFEGWLDWLLAHPDAYIEGYR